MAPFDDNQLHPGELTWPKRIENYRREIKRPAFLTIEDDWVYGVWFIGNNYAKKADIYGGFPGNLLKRIAALMRDRQRPLHLFAGKVDLSVLPGDTLDIRPELNPTFCCNGEAMPDVPLHLYDLVVADPPYSASDAERYGVLMVNRNKVIRELSERLPPGAFVVWLDQVYPMYDGARLRPEAAIGIWGSTNHRIRGLTIFRKT
jgi:hypothetical protein